jgi:hypothetical protein
MTLKHALCSATLAVPLIIAGAGSSAAEVDVGFGLGVGSPYYGMYPYDYGLYDPYGDFTYGGRIIEDEEVDEVIEPAAAPAELAPCVRTNVKNFKNACPS